MTSSAALKFTPPERNLTDPDIYRVATADPFTLLGLLAQAVPYWVYRFRRLHPEYTFPSSFLNDLKGVFSIGGVRIPKYDLFMVLFLALLITIFRVILQNAFQRIVDKMNIYPRFAHKVAETMWKLLFYTVAWLLSLYVQLGLSDLDTFYDPLTMWKGWSSGTAPPAHSLITVIYTLQAAYYTHSIYATLFMDLWRKDSWLMFTHHFIALALLAISYVDRFMLPGALLLFLHDNSDALLEMTKLGHYLKERTDGRKYLFWNIFGNCSFCAFFVVWIIFRLYWYPCKLLYGTVYGAVYLGPQDAPLFPILGIMLLVIYGMNVYWFNFIARMVYRVIVTGVDPEDNREFDTEAVSGLDQQKLDKLANIDKKKTKLN